MNIEILRDKRQKCRFTLESLHKTQTQIDRLTAKHMRPANQMRLMEARAGLEAARSALEAIQDDMAERDEQYRKQIEQMNV